MRVRRQSVETPPGRPVSGAPAMYRFRIPVSIRRRRAFHTNRPNSAIIVGLPTLRWCVIDGTITLVSDTLAVQGARSRGTIVPPG